MAEREIQKPSLLKADVCKYFGSMKLKGERSWTKATLFVSFVESN